MNKTSIDSSTDGHGFTGRAGSPLPAVRGETKHGAHGVTRPTQKIFVFIRVHPWLKSKLPCAAANGCQRIEDERIIREQSDGMTNTRAQPAQSRTREL